MVVKGDCSKHRSCVFSEKEDGNIEVKSGRKVLVPPEGGWTPGKCLKCEAEKKTDLSRYPNMSFYGYWIVLGWAYE